MEPIGPFWSKKARKTLKMAIIWEKAGKKAPVFRNQPHGFGGMRETYPWPDFENLANRRPILSQYGANSSVGQA
jgi:hypothetical protein